MRKRNVASGMGFWKIYREHEPQCQYRSEKECMV